MGEIEPSRSTAKPLPRILNGELYEVQKIENNTVSAICVECKLKCPNKKLTYSASLTATSNLRTHYARAHKDVLTEFDKKHKNKRSLSHDDSDNLTIKERQHLFENNLLDLHVKNMLPIKYTQNEEFFRIVKGLNSKVDNLSEKVINTKIDTEYEIIVKKLKDTLKLIEFITVAVIPFAVYDYLFITIVCHWINSDDLKRQSALLACKLWNNDLDINQLIDEVIQVTESYEIDSNKLLPIVINDVVDSQENFKTVTNTLEEDIFIWSNDLEDDDKDFVNQPNIKYQEVNVISTRDNMGESNFSEAARYQLILLVTEDLVYELKCTDMFEIHCNVFLKCTKLWVALKNNEMNEKIYNSFKIKIKCPSANSFMEIFRSIEDIVDCEDKLNSISKKLNLGIYYEEADIIYLKELRDLLKHFATAIMHLECDDQGYLGNLMPVLFSLKVRLEKLNVQKFVYLETISSNIILTNKEKFKQYFNYTKEGQSAILATCFNPCFKLAWLPETDEDMVKDMCLRAIANLDVNKNSESSQNESSQNTSTDIRSFVLLRKKKSSSRVNKLEIEALSYFEDKINTFKRFEQYPTIKKAFIKYNTQISSSFPTKQMLNQSRLNLLSKCEDLDCNIIEKFVIINANKSK